MGGGTAGGRTVGAGGRVEPWGGGTAGGGTVGGGTAGGRTVGAGGRVEPWVVELQVVELW